jgi:23S rRNA pseudouridine2457 synthase
MDEFPLSYFAVIYKPFQVLSQFSSSGDKRCLRDFFHVPGDVYPVGRLDYDSEGLLILTNDRELNYRLLHPKFAHEREYWVQVEGLIGLPEIRKMESGVEISVEGGKYRTKPCSATLLPPSPPVPERNPPIRFRKNIPTSWISLVLTEGKNRQVRKMTAAAGFPTLRLIRYRVENLTIEGMLAGDLRELDKKELYRALFSPPGQGNLSPGDA